jgi:hypothetical protein
MGDRFSAFRRLLADTKPVWLCVGGFVVAAMLSAIPPGVASDKRVLFGGVWLQIFGLASVARGFADRQRIFGLPSVRSRVIRWLRRLPSIITARTQHIVMTAGITSPGATSGGQADVSFTSTLSRPSLERQVQVLKQEIESLRDSTDRRFAGVDRRFATLRTRIDEDKNALIADHAALASKIHELAVGDLDDEVVGFVWLLFSVVATTIPSDVVWFERLLFG